MLNDARQASRMIGRMPGLAAVVILSLGVGIGVNTAVFSWIQAMVLQPVPGVADTGGFQLAEPHGDNGSYLGASWLENATVRDFTTRLLARLRALPGVESAAIASQVPLDIHGLPPRGFVLEGRARSGAAVERALNNLVTPDYFTTMGIPILAGQDFAALDDRAAAAGRRQRRVRHTLPAGSTAARARPYEPRSAVPHHRRRPHVAERLVRRHADAGDVFLLS